MRKRSDHWLRQKYYFSLSFNHFIFRLRHDEFFLLLLLRLKLKRRKYDRIFVIRIVDNIRIEWNEFTHPE